MYAVITGDIVDSTPSIEDSKQNQYRTIDERLTSAFRLMLDHKWLEESDYVTFRGDSFQCILPAIHGLKAALLIKSVLKGGPHSGGPAAKDLSWSCRLAIGIGEVSYHADQVSKSNGPAFHISGKKLDSLPKDHYTAIVSSWDRINEEFELISRFLDIIIERLWTVNSARTAWVYFGAESELTQREMAELLHISQSAVHGRIHAAELPVIEQTIRRYQSIIKSQTL